MVEGGASVIKSLLVAEGVADTLVVTVSPTLVGSAGVSVATVGGSEGCAPANKEDRIECPSYTTRLVVYLERMLYLLPICRMPDLFQSLNPLSSVLSFVFVACTRLLSSPSSAY